MEQRANPASKAAIGSVEVITVEQLVSNRGTIGSETSVLVTMDGSTIVSAQTSHTKVGVDYASFTSCMKNIGGSNARELKISQVNPRGLTVSTADVPATGIVTNAGDTPKTCVATAFITASSLQ